MTNTIRTRTTLTSIGLVGAAMALPAAASAQDFMPDIQPLGVEETRTLPRDLQSAPRTLPSTARTAASNLGETSIGPDGVETITRTRRIARSVPATQAVAPTQVAQTQYAGELPPLPQGQGYAPAYGQGYAHSYSPGAQVFQREQWIDECERRTDGYGGRRKGGIIGGLLGAVAGGVLGNRLWDSERLAGTLIGVGAGGIGGALLGSLIGGGRNDRGEYDCEAALDAYLSQYAAGGTRIASRSIPAPAPVYAAPVYAAPVYAAPQQYYYAPPQQITYVPIQYQQRQRVIVRETVREEVIPGARRTIPAPRPVTPPVSRPLPQPIPIKGQPRYIKGN